MDSILSRARARVVGQRPQAMWLAGCLLVWGALSLVAGTVNVNVGQAKQTVTTFGGDVKLTLDAFVALSPPQQQTVVDALFIDINLNVVRIPMYPEASPAEGVNDWSHYDKVLAFVSKLPPGVKLFLSPAETVAPGYPAWCTTGVKLAKWETDVANYLAGQGYPISYLGPGNEDPFSASFFSQAISAIKSNLLVTIIGPEKWATMDSATFVQANPNVGFEIYGSHDYDIPAASVWESLSTAAGAKECWYSEATGVGGSGNQVLAGMGRAFEALKGGCDGIVAYQIYNRYARIGTGGALVRPQAYYAYQLLANHTLNKTQVGVARADGAPDTIAFKGGNTVVVHCRALTATNTTFDFSPSRINGVTRFGVTEGGSGVTQSNLTATAALSTFTDSQSANVFYTYVITLEPPRVDALTLAPTGIHLLGSGGSSNGLCYVLTSTNMILALSNWSRITTNMFQSDGSFSIGIPVNPAEAFRFFRIETP